MIYMHDREYGAALEGIGLKSFDDFYRFQNEYCYKRNKYRAVYKIVLQGRKNVFMKKHFLLPKRSLLPTLLFDRRSEARREFENMVLISQLGIRTLRPIGYGERPRLGLPLRSFLLTESLEDLPRLEDVVAKSWSRSSFAKKKQLIDKLAGIVSRLHSHNLFHKDLYLGHILFDGQAPEFYLIDLQRLRKHNKRLHRWRVKDLSSLNYSADLCGVDTRDRLRFLRTYCRLMGDRSGAYVERIARKSELIRKHTLKRYLKNQLRKKTDRKA